MPNPDRRDPRGLTRSLVIDVAMPWIAVQLLQRVWGVPTVPAFAAAAIFPATSVLLSWTRHRRPEYIGIGVLVTILSGIAVALLTNDVRFAVLKGAPAFGLFGLACLVSLRRERPLMFFVSRQFVAGDDEARALAWTARLVFGLAGRGDARDRCGFPLAARHCAGRRTDARYWHDSGALDLDHRLCASARAGCSGRRRLTSNPVPVTECGHERDQQ